MGKVPVGLAYFYCSKALVGLGLIIVEVLGSHTVRPTTFGRTPVEK